MLLLGCADDVCVRIAPPPPGSCACGVEVRLYFSQQRYPQQHAASRLQALSVARKLQQARNYTLSADDIGRILKEKREKGLVKRSLAMMKADLVLKRNAALEAGDDAAAALCAPYAMNRACAVGGQVAPRAR